VITKPYQNCTQRLAWGIQVEVARRQLMIYEADWKPLNDGHHSRVVSFSPLGGAQTDDSGYRPEIKKKMTTSTAAHRL
jgi:hypothetical protein